MCVRCVRCLWSVSTASVKNRAWNPNWAWLSLIYLAAQRRDKVPARVEVVPLYRQLFSAWNIVSYLCELVRSYAILRDAHELELIPPKKRLNNCCLGLFEGGRGFDRGKINSETPSMNFAANVPLWNRFFLFFILFYFLSHLRSNVKIPGGRMNGYDYS